MPRRSSGNKRIAMETPDLTTKAGRKAWRHDMRMVAVRPRRAGMILLAVGIGTMLLPLAGVHDVGGWSPRVLGLVPVALSIPFLIAARILRGRWVRGRLASGQKV